MTIVDTSVWIDYLAGPINAHAAWLEREIALRPIGLTDQILCEVLQGVRGDAAFKGIGADLRKFTIFDTGGERLATTTAKNYRLLRARGFTVRKTIDCFIATFCITHGHTLLHRDRDFEPFEACLGLRVHHPVN